MPAPITAPRLMAMTFLSPRRRFRADRDQSPA
jgi:hypothetical protein